MPSDNLSSMLRLSSGKELPELSDINATITRAPLMKLKLCQLGSRAGFLAVHMVRLNVLRYKDTGHFFTENCRNTNLDSA